MDRFGNPLDGNADGTGGDDLVRFFTVDSGQRLRAGEPQQQQHPGATPLPLFEDPAGSGFFTSSIAVGAIDPGGDSDYWSFNAQQATS